MAEVINIDDIYEARVVCADQSFSQYAINVFHYSCVDKSGNDTLDTDFADDFSDHIHAQYKAVLNIGATFYGVDVRRVHPLPTTLPAVSTHDQAVGTVAGDQLPSQIAGLIKLQTGFAGPGGRGRKYIPFPGEGDNAASGLQTAAANLRYAALAARFPMDITSINVGVDGQVVMRPVLINRETGNIRRVIDATPRMAWATQMRRGRLRRGDAAPF